MLDVLSGVPTPQGVGVGVGVNEEERDPKRMRVELTLSDFKIPSYGLSFDIQLELKKVLPCLAQTYKNKDWFLLHKYTSSSTGFSLDMEHALKSEYPAICVWLLLSEFPPHIKDVAARVLASICFGTSEAPNMSNQESIDNLVSRVLRDGASVEVKRQVCFSISFLARCSNPCLVLHFGAGLQDGLLQLIRNPCCSSELTFPLISAIANIAIVNDRMKQKILESELDDSWLGKLMDTTLNRPILEQACYAVACMTSFACGKQSEKLWDHLKLKIIPAIINKCSIMWDRSMLGAAAAAISRITKYAASSPDQIEYLVWEGCLWALFHVNRLRANEILWSSLIGIEIILEAGDVVEGRRKHKPRPKHNEYAKLIDDFEYGWDRLIAKEPYYNYESIVKAKNILTTYRPHLLRHYDWRYEGRFDPEAWDESDYSDDDDESDDDDDVDA